MTADPIPQASPSSQMRRYVFVVGSPRSGTTWLQLLLAQHPAVATHQETHLFHNYLGPLERAYRGGRDTAQLRDVGIHNVVDGSTASAASSRCKRSTASPRASRRPRW
jgi:hypothetical protein